MSQIVLALGRELNSRIALHRKLLYARVPSLPVSTWEMAHDLPSYDQKNYIRLDPRDSVPCFQ